MSALAPFRSASQRRANAIPTRHRPPSATVNDPALGVWADASLQNSWVNTGTGYLNCSYKKDANGMVWIRGAIKNGTTTVGTLVFTLPVGYRPAAKERLFVGETGGLVIDIDVATNGQVTLQFNSGSANLFFDYLSFQAAEGLRA